MDSVSYPYTYLTSSREDFHLYISADSIHDVNSRAVKATLSSNPNAEFEYIGDSDSPKAISRLNRLVADVVMMSTPQLDVLQIKRSKGVKHYCHIIHSLPHVDIYEIFALDCFDSVFTNSTIHTDFIRKVEKVRNLPAKKIIITGCTYLDILQEKLYKYQKLEHDKKIHFFPKNEKKTTILLAPSWGREALLSKYGMQLIEPFIESQFNLIIRPHPQSYVSQKELLDSLQEQTKECKNIVWDNNTDNIYALDSADIMIGDFSGVLFDFICLFEKPVLTPIFTFNITGYDLEDIYDTPWVKDALTKIGKSIEPSEFINLPHIIESLLQDKEAFYSLEQSIKEMKKLLWEYQGISGIKSAQEILQIQKQILESRLQEKINIHNNINTINKALESMAQIFYKKSANPDSIKV